jgi:hypothetical protein
MQPEDYAPAYDFRGLGTVEALQWAVGGDIEDVTGGKSVEINAFPRARLDDVAVRHSLPSSNARRAAPAVAAAMSLQSLLCALQIIPAAEDEQHTKPWPPGGPEMLRVVDMPCMV